MNFAFITLLLIEEEEKEEEENIHENCASDVQFVFLPIKTFN